MKKILITLIIIFILILTGCTEKSPTNQNADTKSNSNILEAEKTVFAMDTFMTLKAYGENAEDALNEAEAEIIKLDKLLSTGDPESEIYKINNEGGGSLSDISAYLLKYSLEINKQYDGAFNPLIYPIMRAWGFTDNNFRVPGASELKNLLTLTDVDDIVFDENTGIISFKKDGMQLDFGGIAKGYTSSCVMELLKNKGINSAIISLGGNVQALGSKINGSPWKVAVVDPFNNSSYLGTLQIIDKCVITSGAYERNFSEDGILYHHIIDPETGYPASSGIVSATVVSDDGTLADALSTTFYILGLERSIELWRSNSDKYDIILMTDEGNLYVSEGISNEFTSSRKFEVISVE